MATLSVWGAGEAKTFRPAETAPAAISECCRNRLLFLFDMANFFGVLFFRFDEGRSLV
jgi:hypothetical protein